MNKGILKEVKEKIKLKKTMEEETKPVRKYANRLTIGILEDADLPMDKADITQLTSTKDLIHVRKLLNAAMIEGPKFTRDSDPAELFDAMDDLKSFLANSRLHQKRQELKEKRSPKR